MSLLDLLNRPGSARLALALLHFLWQGLAIAVTFRAALWLCRVKSPRVRYGVNVAALLAMGVCVPATYLLISGAQSAGLPQSGLQAAAPSDTEQPARSADVLSVELAAAEASVGTPPQNASVSRSVEERLRRRVASIQPFILTAWVCGVLLCSLRLLLGMIGVEQLRWTATALPAEWTPLVERLCRRLGLRRIPRVRLSRRIAEPLAVGAFRPLVLLPAGWMLEVPASVLEAVLAHELAHVRRWDLCVDALQRLMETLLFYHPAVWWISRGIRIERELCCDRLAVAATGRTVEYARALEFVATKQLAGRRPVLATGIGGHKMQLLERVRQILRRTDAETGRDVSGRKRHLGWWSLVVLGLAVPALFFAAGTGPGRLLADGEEPGADRRDSPAAERDGDRAPGERDREHGPRDGDRGPREGERKNADRGPRHGDRERDVHGPRDGDREPGALDISEETSREDLIRMILHLRRELEAVRRAGAPRGPFRDFRSPFGDRPRPDGAPRDGDRPHPEAERRDGDRPHPEGERRDDSRPHREGPPRDLGDHPPLELERGRLQPEVLQLIRDLQIEVRQLRNEVNHLRGRRGEGERERAEYEEFERDQREAIERRERGEIERRERGEREEIERRERGEREERDDDDGRENEDRKDSEDGF